ATNEEQYVQSLEKFEKREHAKQHGMIRTEFSGGEIAEDMEKERRIFQLQMCELTVITSICTFSVEKMGSELTIKQTQDGERKQLSQLRDVLKASLHTEQKEELQAKQSVGYNLHQLQGNKAHGTEYSGFLYKKSEG
uniref:Uncharacterized protein n=1 Tax=Xiphophorus couchianus TaxID=32473 RepID=A0A3B5MXJ0_9TELE